MGIGNLKEICKCDLCEYGDAFLKVDINDKSVPSFYYRCSLCECEYTTPAMMKINKDLMLGIYDIAIKGGIGNDCYVERITQIP